MLRPSRKGKRAVNEIALKAMLRDVGLKKLLAVILKMAGVIEEDSAGQIVAHINSGGVTKVYKNIEVK
jgi:hypothetical protein